ncbi:hypothetical protein [Actinobaculum sp. 352]|uniref:hypothetical protein n=1 Tax=Actinobaculum sp. 352 TaxID=2490946 RepID=UPI000F7ED0CA|nr:hypothetical protein [Actinobaculum sp. 352]RTE47668.1 hypothetical protein EKN07_12275 [Actinobaculum sp. 352]
MIMSPLIDSAVIVAMVAMIGGAVTAGITGLVQRRNATASHELSVLSTTVNELQEQADRAERRADKIQERMDSMDQRFGELRKELASARDSEYVMARQNRIWQDHVATLEQHIRRQLPPPPPARPVASLAAVSDGKEHKTSAVDNPNGVDETDDEEGNLS